MPHLQGKSSDETSFSGSAQFLTFPTSKKNENRKYLIALVFLSALSIGCLVSTIILALKLKGAYPSARVQYHVWSHPNANTAEKNQLRITVPDNATLFTVMEHAALGDPSFQFEFSQHDFGKYISSIGGVEDNIIDNLFWMVYRLPVSPNPNVPPTQKFLLEKGVDDIRVKDGDVILFWLTEYQPDYDASISIQNHSGEKQGV